MDICQLLGRDQDDEHAQGAPMESPPLQGVERNEAKADQDIA